MSQSFIAEIVLLHRDLPLASTIRELPAAAVSVHSQPQRDPDEGSVAFYVVRDADFHEFERALTNDHTTDGWEISMEFTESRIYKVELSSETEFITSRITLRLSEVGIQILSIRNDDQGWRFELQAPNKESLGAFWEYCREEEIEFRLEKLYSSDHRVTTAEKATLKAQLTERQLEVARTVARMGYYDRDGASAEEVAAELGISPSTLSTHLRRIMANVFDFIFEGDDVDATVEQ